MERREDGDLQVKLTGACERDRRALLVRWGKGSLHKLRVAPMLRGGSRCPRREGKHASLLRLQPNIFNAR